MYEYGVITGGQHPRVQISKTFEHKTILILMNTAFWPQGIGIVLTAFHAVLRSIASQARGCNRVPMSRCSILESPTRPYSNPQEQPCIFMIPTGYLGCYWAFAQGES